MAPKNSPYKNRWLRRHGALALLLIGMFMLLLAIIYHSSGELTGERVIGVGVIFLILRIGD